MLNAYIVDVEGEIVAIRAATSDAVTKLMGARIRSITSLPAPVAQAMSIPEEEGIYKDAIPNWVWGPTNLFGELGE